MFYLIISIALVIIICSFINNTINAKRQIHFNEMNSLYDKMEIYVYENNLQNDNKIVRYMIPHKHFVVNNGFADIQVLLAIILALPEKVLEKRKSEFKQLNTEIPGELQTIAKKFDSHLAKAIRLSYFRAEFVLFAIVQFLKTIYIAILERSYKAFKVFKNSLYYAKEFETVLFPEPEYLDNKYAKERIAC